MKIYFGETLKRLRKESGLTQEELGGFLGVTFQTISKWELGETYPDITMLPRISSFFGITADELLGADKIIKEKKIKAYIKLYDEMKLTDAAAVYNEFQSAVKEFPNNYDIMIRYMELLKLERQTVKRDYKKISPEIAACYDRIMKHCTDDGIRIRAKRLLIDDLMWKYQCLGFVDENEKKFDEKYYNEAQRIISSLPAMADSREYNLLYLDGGKAFDEEKHNASQKAAIEELSYLLNNVVTGYCYYSKRFTPEYKINAMRHMNGIFELIDTDEIPTKNRIHMIYNNGHMGRVYAEAGDSENALKCFRLAAEQARELDAMPETEQRIALFYEREEATRNMRISQRMYELLTKHYPLPEELRKTEEFKEIVESLK